MADKPQTGEIAPSYQAGITLFSQGLLQNPDPIIAKRGGRVGIYDELLRDDQIGPCLEQRRRAVVQSEWEVDPASESPADQAAAQDLRDQLQRIRFDEITDQMLYALIYGYSVAEVIWGTDGQRVTIDDIKVRDRERFRFDQRRNLTLFDTGTRKAITMPERKFWTLSMGGDTSDNPYGRGLGHLLYWPAFFKRNAIKFCMVYLDKFASPTAMGKIPNSMRDDEQQINEILQMLDSIQTDAAVTIPEDVQVELMEATRNGSPEYIEVINRMDSAIAKVILSQTMTTQDGSSRSQAEVHKEVRDEVVKADADLVTASFNMQIAKWLTEFNHPEATPPQVWRRTEPQEDLESTAERDKKIMSLGFEPTDEYIRETYGPGWRRKQQSPTRPPGNGPIPEDFTEVTNLAQGRTNHRADQQRIKDAAVSLAEKYPELLGDRIQQLLSIMDESDDPVAFKENLAQLMAEPPDEKNVETVRNATFLSRLMGMWRQQR